MRYEGNKYTKIKITTCLIKKKNSWFQMGQTFENWNS